MIEIYEFILSHAKLSNVHKNQLIKKRGFTTDTIKQNRFVSGGKYLLEIESQLIKMFNSSELVKSGVMLKKGKNLHLSPQLLDDRIIIPYLNNSGKAYLLRPHKFGLKNVAIELYQTQNIIESQPLIITEGEFKACASVQMGFSCIAVAGIASFSNKHYKKLETLLSDKKIKDICIIFDNEVKDDPELKKMYKSNPMKRYDVQYYAYTMCLSLDKGGYNCTVGTLPDSWRKDGKIDIDSALAQGKTRSDFDQIIQKSKEHKEYRNSLSSEAQVVISKKITKKHMKQYIRTDFNRYIATRYRKGGEMYDEVISNFTLRITATHDNPAGMIREMTFVNEHGERSRSMEMTSDNMASIDNFARFALSKGNFLWSGRKEDLFNIWESEFLDNDGRYIKEFDHIGYVESDDMWLFGNVAFTKNTELRPDKSNIFWTEKKGFKPISIIVSSGRESIAEGIPYLNFSSIDINIIADKFRDSIGEHYANMCLSYITSVLYSTDVFNFFHCFPFLFITGEKNTGKSTIAEWLMNFYGIENAGKMASETTSVFLQRYLSYYSSLPIFVDEYRNTTKVKAKDGLLRNVYNRQSAGKGIKSDFGTRVGKIRGTLILSGEETPHDNALLSRCIIVQIFNKNRNKNHFEWFMRNKAKFSYHTYNTLKNKNIDKYMEIFRHYKTLFVEEEKLDDRSAINYAVLMAGYHTMFGKIDDMFYVWLVNEAKRIKVEYHSEQAVNMFFENVLAMESNGDFSKNNKMWRYDEVAHEIYLYFQGIYSVWAKSYRQLHGEPPFKASAIRSYMREKEGYKRCSSTHKINGKPRKCVVFDSKTAPLELRMLVDADELIEANE